MVGLAAASIFAFADPAAASLDGPCTASGTIVETGARHDAKTTDKATIPRTGKVAWEGSSGRSGERETSGEVTVAFPPPIGDQTVGEWGKDGEKSSKPGNNGTYVYDLPSVIAGIDIPVSGFHDEPGIHCSGTVVVTIEGTSPLVWGSMAFTVISIAGLYLSIRARPR
jgi:hypothetical protein